ncbi:GSCFA domain-containing protein [Chondrinema litorale]|uniref:GSCFA domain-containing protein n=1 Tax=Chondrinema litorale TaxID=2994555 RepID=UPI002543AC88|nr:GSCFA domain-containing protein [Chondrinema litorale]UZR94073.1 GSCFA domain-containing protein [Chondrinema litorale]
MSKSFRTEISLHPPTKQISLKDKILTIGSCFSDNIGNLLQRYKFDTLVNPFGVIFNPISSLHLLQHAYMRHTLSNEKIIQNQGMFYHYDLHSEITSAEKDSLKSLIDKKIHETGEFLHKTDVLALTFGTAFVYRLLENKEVVANCHKMPARYFHKELLTPEQIILAFNELHKKLSPETTIILTISPIRHIKDTLPLNSVSKSVLRLACHHLSESHPNVFYFPAYEMMMDDLRDYRFYEADMLHPNDTAINYIWEHFSNLCITDKGNRFMHKWDKILKAIEHRPFHPYSEEHRHFLMNTLDKLKTINEADVSKEITMLEERLQLFSV